MHIFVLAFVFLIVAFIYSSIGLGGGSSYTALLVLAGTDYKVIPVVSLILNILVSSLISRFSERLWQEVIQLQVQLEDEKT